MDLANKEALLAKFWKGMTSVTEEAALKKLCQDRPELFTSDEQMLLNSLSEMSQLKLSADFGKQVLAAEMAKEQSSLKNSGRRISLPSYLLRIAAAVLFLIAISWSVQKWSADPLVDNSPETIEAEFQEAQQALLLIASKMSKVKSVTTALGKFQTTHDKIKSINPR